jgi:hypothetical protein
VRGAEGEHRGEVGVVRAGDPEQVRRDSKRTGDVRERAPAGDVTAAGLEVRS